MLRFLREATIQARLDHPSIVPVHELGEDAEGRPFFVMKRLAGTTLAVRLSDGEPTTRLLRARRGVVAGWVTLATVLPFLLEAIGLIDDTWEVQSRGVLLRGSIFVQSSTTDAVVMMIANGHKGP